MGKFAVTLTAAALVLGSLAFAAKAQTQTGAASLRGQAQNASPVKEAACWGWGGGCRPGWRRVCGPYRCWCRVC